MKYPEEFSHEAVNKRSLKAARSLDSYRRSSKVKTDLDDARMDKKERRPLKEFTELRAELIDENVSVAHTTMPPNILILRRKTVRQFPNNTMVALYFNDKLNQYFSIPYGSGVESVVSPVNVNINEEHQPGDKVRYRSGSEAHLRVGTVKSVEADHIIVQRGGFNYKVPHKSVVYNERSGYRPEEMNEAVELTENAISHLQKVKAFATDKPLYHKDGTQTRVDPTTANALLTVHSALHPDNRKQFADALEHSKGKFNRMLDFTWRQVK